MKTTKTKKTPWPPAKPHPKFATRSEVERFWITHDGADARLREPHRGAGRHCQCA